MAWAKGQPGKLSYGSTGTMTSPHLTMELIAQQLGIELLHVPYKGSADLMQSILGGQIMAAADSTGFAPQVEAGKLRVLNTWGAERLARFDAPTLKELGLNLVQNSPFGIGRPRARPMPVVKRLHDAFKQAMEQDGYKAGTGSLRHGAHVRARRRTRSFAGHLHPRRRWSRNWVWPNPPEATPFGGGNAFRVMIRSIERNSHTRYGIPSDSISMALFCDFENVAWACAMRSTKIRHQAHPGAPAPQGLHRGQKAYCDWERYRASRPPCTRRTSS